MRVPTRVLAARKHDRPSTGKRDLAAMRVTAHEQMHASPAQVMQSLRRMADNDHVVRRAHLGKRRGGVDAPCPWLVEADEDQTLVRLAEPMSFVDEHPRTRALE